MFLQVISNYRQMYKFTVKQTKTKSITEIKDFINIVGELYFRNHKWKVSVEKSSVQIPQIRKNSTIQGTDLIEIMESGVKFYKASFSALEGDQIAFMISCGDVFTVHAIQARWLEFFREKCIISDIQELDNHLPEFRDFMQD